MTSKFLLRIVLLFMIVGAISCGDNNSKKKKNKEKTYLPPARGEANVILVVMDTSDWQSEVGLTLKDIFSEYVVGLPQAEPYFKIRNINPTKFNSILKTAKNILFVSSLDNYSRQGQKMKEYFTDNSLKKIDKDSSLFMMGQKNMFANGQEILHLFGQTKPQLIEHLKQNKSRLRNYFIEIEGKRLSKQLFKVREKGIEKKMEEDYGFRFNIPYGYDVSKSMRDFFWVRQLDPEFEKNVFVYFQPYNTKEPFDDVIEFREKITSTYMHDVEKPEIYMTLQGEEYQHIREVNFNGKYAKESRGLWKLSDISGGGSYISYVFVDEVQKRMYYLEAYVYAPSKDKRIFMQEMELILQTFASGSDIKK